MIAQEVRIFLMEPTIRGRKYQESLMKRLKSLGYTVRRLEHEDEIGVVARYRFDDFFTGE